MSCEPLVKSESTSISHLAVSDSVILWTVVSQALSVHGISQPRILEWVAVSFSRGSSWLRDKTWGSCIAGRFFTIWATREGTGDIAKCRFGFPASGWAWDPLFLTGDKLTGDNDARSGHLTLSSWSLGEGKVEKCCFQEIVSFWYLAFSVFKKTRMSYTCMWNTNWIAISLPLYFPCPLQNPDIQYWYPSRGLIAYTSLDTCVYTYSFKNNLQMAAFRSHHSALCIFHLMHVEHCVLTVT